MTPVTSAPAQCKAPYTKIYIQYKCEMDEEGQSEKMQLGYIIFLCGVVISVVYKFVIAYLDVTTNHNYQAWDANTCTPADYTIEVPITPKMHANHVHHKKDSQTLDQHIKTIIIDQVKKLPPVEENV